MKLNIQLFASGTIFEKTSGKMQGKLIWTSTINEAGTGSNVVVSLYVRRTDSSTTTGHFRYNLTIDDESWSGSTKLSVSNKYKLVASKNKEIEYSGEYSCYIYGRLRGPTDTSLESASVSDSDNVSLDATTYPATLNSVNIDNFVSQGKFTPNFTINQQGLYYAMYIISYTPIELIVSWSAPIPVSNGVEATLTDEQKQTLWNVLDGKTNRTANDIKFVLGSYTDSGLTNQVGGTDVDFVNSIAIPSYSLQWDSATLGDTGMGTYYGGHPLYYYVNDMNSTFIKTLSTPYLSFSASSTTGYLYGKTITYTINGIARTSPYTDTSWNGGTTYTITASDGRVDSITTTLSKNVLDYFVPYLSNIRVVRPIPTGDKVRVSYTANYYDGTGLINLTNAVYNFYYRESESDSWTPYASLSGTGTNGTATFTNIDISGMNYKKPFYYKIEFTDRIGNTTQVYPYASHIPKGLPVWNAYTDSSDNNVLNVNGILAVDKIDYNKGLYFKENGYGDKFKIVPSFGGVDDSNVLLIQSAVGGAGTDPALDNIFAITALSGNIWNKGTYNANNGFYSKPDGNVSTQTATDALVIKRATAGVDDAPNTGVVLEYGRWNGWGGQLYIGDNAEQGIWYNGWSNGTRGTWKKLQIVEDSGWINLPTSSNFESYSWGTLRYRKLNGVVTIMGVVKALVTTGWLTLVANLPDGFRPPMEYNVVCRTSRPEVMKLIVNEVGEIWTIDTSAGTYLQPNDSLEIAVTYIAA